MNWFRAVNGWLMYPRKAIVQRIVFIPIPLLILALDIVCFPSLWDYSGKRNLLQATAVAGKQLTLMGIFHGHKIQVDSSSLVESNCLSHLDLSKDTKRALAISYFTDADLPRLREGGLGKAVLAKIEAVSLVDGQNVKALLSKNNSAQAGQILSLKLEIPPPSYSQFPVDNLFIVILKYAKSSETAEVLPGALSRLINQSEEARATTLVLPCLGYYPGSSNSLDSDVLFRELFEALASDEKPMTVCLSFYSGWPSDIQKSAVASFNRVWPEAFHKHVAGLARFTHYRTRFTFVMWAVCLAVCAMVKPLDLKNFLIISAGFGGLAYGSIELVDFVGEGWSHLAREMIQLVVWLVLASGFPIIVGWDPVHIFERNKNGH